MSAAALLADLEAAGFHVRIEGERLLLGPRHGLTDEQRELVRGHRDELWAIVVARAVIRARPDTWHDPEPDRCSACGAPAIGYSPAAEKACAVHLHGGEPW
jgi:hypothetical protein